ncbi:hypothetical protein QCA50_011002 [Cerrena zonata]|uniref:CID domain-containing protein n=1 Tax=Cerrena zonata TaxID=2478898 RepID=A0AAW0FVT8_9APHY
MSSLETFESTLKEVVEAKRLSQSKMKKLTDNALKCMRHDTQLVSALYRTHKTLLPAQKISSLYVFDALTRAARHQVTKQDIKADPKSERGNCATFLLKVEGVLDSLFLDMLALDRPDAKEKTKKIVDIWVKSNTFPPEVLARLSKYVKEGTEQDPNKDKSASTATTDPRQHATPPVAAPTPPQATTTPPQVTSQITTPANDVQSTLLALLSQVANNGQTTVNTPTSAPVPTAPQLDASQLALFQQLAQTAKAAGNIVPAQPLPLPLSLMPSASAIPVPPVAPPNGGHPHAQTLPYRDDHFGPGRRDSEYDRFDGPERARDRDDYYDDRRDFRGDRGDFRGRYNRGGFRGGRGAGRGRWDDREQYSDRNRERDWDSPPSTRYSRSRSPPRNKYPGRRDVRPYSPPRRPSVSHAPGAPSITTNSSTLESGKDEFGRDIRPKSPEQGTPSRTTFPNPTTSLTPVADPSSVASIDDGPEKPTGQLSALAQTASTSTAPSSSKSPTNSSQNETGLDTFDLTAFNPTEASSWEGLGKAWAVTNGYAPSQEELMQYVMGNMFAVASQFGIQEPQPQQGIQTWTSDDEPQSWNHAQSSRGRGRGRGGFTHGNSRGGGQWGYSGDRRGDDRGTDAVMLGGGDDMDTSDYDVGYEGGGWQDGQQQYGTGAWPGDQDYASQGTDPQKEGVPVDDEGGSGGRMQKVGGKWVYVRPGVTTAAVS